MKRKYNRINNRFFELELKDNLIKNNYKLSNEQTIELKNYVFDYIENSLLSIYYKDESDYINMSIHDNITKQDAEILVNDWNDIVNIFCALYLLEGIHFKKIYIRLIQLYNIKLYKITKPINWYSEDTYIEVWARSNDEHLKNKLSYIIDNIDKSESNKACIDIEQLLAGLDIPTHFDYSYCGVYSNINNKELLNAYWLKKYNGENLGGDGIYAIFFKNKFVAIVNKDNRKYDKYEWVNAELMNIVRDYILDIIKAYKPTYENETFLDLDKDMGDGYILKYFSQISNYEDIKLNGVCVDIDINKNEHRHSDEITLLSDEIEIIINGNNQDIEISKLRFPYNCKK